MREFTTRVYCNVIDCVFCYHPNPTTHPLTSLFVRLACSPLESGGIFHFKYFLHTKSTFMFNMSDSIHQAIWSDTTHSLLSTRGQGLTLTHLHSYLQFHCVVPLSCCPSWLLSVHLSLLSILENLGIHFVR